MNFGEDYTTDPTGFVSISKRTRFVNTVGGVLIYSTRQSDRAERPRASRESREKGRALIVEFYEFPDDVYIGGRQPAGRAL